VARYLAAAGQEEDPERAYQYAAAARELAARVGIVRETCAIAAYQAGRWADALAEFRAARRLTGRASYLPLMADCERALGRLDRALDIVTGPEARAADRATQLELRIVESGIRRDQGLPEAAVVALQVPELTARRSRTGNARLLYAYADALLEAGREEEAREWFGRAAAADRQDETDAAERVEELDEILFEDLDDEDDPDEYELSGLVPASDEPADAESADAASAEAGSADVESATGAESAAIDPAEAGSAHFGSAADKSAEAELADAESTDIEPAEPEPAEVESASGESAKAESADAESTDAESAGNLPAEAEPVEVEPADDEPGRDDAADSGPVSK
jgi:tetratricopeptide (TPR) repeat protein